MTQFPITYAPLLKREKRLEDLVKKLKPYAMLFGLTCSVHRTDNEEVPWDFLLTGPKTFPASVTRIRSKAMDHPKRLERELRKAIENAI